MYNCIHFDNNILPVLHCFEISQYCYFHCFLVRTFCSERNCSPYAFHSGSELEKLHLTCLIVFSNCTAEELFLIYQAEKQENW